MEITYYSATVATASDVVVVESRRRVEGGKF